jgi:predicted phosphodiesterase
LKNENIKPNFIVITGDIAEWSLREEYVLAEDFLDSLTKHLNIDRGYVIMVPSNHDINRNVCQGSRLLSEPENQEFKPPYFAKFKYYEEFFSRFYQMMSFPKNIVPYTFKEDQLFVNYYFPDEGILFSGLNSCIDECEKEPHYGNITISQLQRAIDEINDFDPKTEMLRVCLMHHNFNRSSNNDEENLIDADELKPLLIKAKFQLILHGHQHIPRHEITGKGNYSINVLATGSAGLDSETIPDNSRRYQIIDIERNAVKVYRRFFDSQAIHTTGRGCWKPDLDPSQNAIYEEFVLSTGLYENKIGDIAEKPKTIFSGEGLKILYEYTIPETHPCPGANISDLDWALVEKYARKVSPSLLDEISNKEDVLLRLGLYSQIPYQDGPAFHKSAVLCFCLSPDKFTTVLNTETRSKFIVGNPGDSEIVIKEIQGPLSSQFTQLYDLALQHLGNVASISEDGRRHEIKEIEPLLIRELISNAITHRDYNSNGCVQVNINTEAFEIRSPGKFPKDATWDEFVKGLPVSIPINLAISQYLKNLLVFEGIGQGFSIIRKYIKENGYDNITYNELPGETICIRVLRLKHKETLSPTIYDGNIIQATANVLKSKPVERDLNIDRRKEAVLKILNKAGIKLGTLEPNFNSIYARTLIEYGIDKPKLILNFFENEYIQKAFQESFLKNDFSILNREADSLIEWSTTGDELRMKEIDARLETCSLQGSSNHRSIYPSIQPFFAS